MDLVEKLLQVDKNKVAEKKRGLFYSNRLNELVGDGTVEIIELDPERLSELQSMIMDNKGNVDFSKNYTASLYIAAEGIVSPDLKDARLREHFGAQTVPGLAKILFSGEIIDIADAIQDLGKWNAIEEKEVKN